MASISSTISNAFDSQSPDTDLADVTPPQDAANEFEHCSLGTRIASLFGIIVPFAGFATAVALLWGRGFGWVHASLLVGMYLISAVGITVGYHRLFCHRSFKTNRVVQCILAIFGSMAFEGPVLKWVAMHRCHHQHSDKAGDPHSPNHHGDGVLGVMAGWWHAHAGWIFQGDPKNLARFVPDLMSNGALRVVSNLWVLWAALGLIVPAALGGLLTHTWMGVFLGFLWGGLVRVFLVHHVTWSVNSVCHLWGARPYKSHDLSRNNFIFGVLAMGEGWHNNHHAFPTSARHGLKWWQVDASYYFIVVLSWLGLAWDLKVPDEARMARSAAA
ncbi:MAG: acyl-CoA desaturase [Planctomycetota bacterium]|nr:acyl-CoA desaturase [Planctomycetota bacterium]